MSSTAWRICHPKHVDSAFSGEGAETFGGRWNSVGTKMVYTSDAQSLAILEILVHVDSYSQIKNHIIIPVTFEDSLVSILDIKDIPVDWQTDPVSPSTQKIGDAWVKTFGSAVLCVPSTISPGQHNFLINPDHPDISGIEIGDPEPLYLDSRLIEKLK